MYTDKLGTIEQVIRIVLYMAGSFLLGDGVAQSAEYQAGVGAVISAGSFIWWIYRQRKVGKS